MKLISHRAAQIALGVGIVLNGIFAGINYAADHALGAMICGFMSGLSAGMFTSNGFIFYFWKRLQETQAQLNACREVHAEEVGRSIAACLAEKIGGEVIEVRSHVTKH